MAANKKSAMSAVKSAVKKATGRSTATSTRGTPSKATAKKATAKKATAKKATAKKATAKKATAKKAPARKAAAKKSATKKAPAKKGAAKKGAAKKSPATKKAAATQVAAAGPTAKAATKKAATKKASGRRTTPGRLAVRAGEKPWTAKQVAGVKATLEYDAERLEAEIAAAEKDINHLLREGGEGAGNDQADVGANTFERDHEMTMAKNAREQRALVHAALRRIDDGTYGVCESCGNPIGKMRLQAFPRATLCMECKQRQERR